ncbi:MAG: septum site-determining protein MinC [Bordetella sp.]|nr:MAG: septum site-determining protein MinC [Bordetella sp.]
MIKNSPAILTLKGSSLYVICILIYTSDIFLIKKSLEERLHDIEFFGKHEAIVIDSSYVNNLINWPLLIKILKNYNLPLVGVVAKGENRKEARKAGIEIVEVSTKSKRKLKVDPKNLTSTSSLVISKPLRSGQKIYAHNTDLIVVGMVSQGAEIIADGNIHVYGPLRGKAMAGASGDTSMRIFTTQLNAELIAIAGVYQLFEDKCNEKLDNQPALIELRNEVLIIQSIGSI